MPGATAVRFGTCRSTLRRERLVKSTHRTAGDKTQATAEIGLGGSWKQLAVGSRDLQIRRPDRGYRRNKSRRQFELWFGRAFELVSTPQEARTGLKSSSEV